MKRTLALVVMLTMLVLAIPTYADTIVDPDTRYFSWPTESTRVTGVFGGGRNHKGIDIGVLDTNNPYNDDVIAAQSGTVVFNEVVTYKDGKSAPTLVINHDMRSYNLPSDYYQTVYTHCSDILVDVGDTVRRNQKIATMAGLNSYPIHLHYEIREIDSIDQTYSWSGNPVVNPLYLYQGPIIQE